MSIGIFAKAFSVYVDSRVLWSRRMEARCLSLGIDSLC